MIDSQRTIDSSTVAHFVAWSMLSVAPIAEVCGAKAVEDSHATAVVALPVDVSVAVDLTISNSCSVAFEFASLALVIFFFVALLNSLFDHAVNHAAKVGLFTLIALVEGAGVHGKALEIAKVVVPWCLKSLILV